VCEIDWGRHERALFIDLAFGAGEAEHHALVAGPLLLAILLLFRVHTHRDIRRLAMQQDLDIGAVIRKAILVVTNVFDDAARNFGDHFPVHDGLGAVFVKQRGLATALTGNDNLIGGAQRLAAEAGIYGALVGYAELEIVLDERVENGVRYLVTNLVGMPLRDGFAGEQIIGAAQSEILPSKLM
jgi:hypothetical protein